MAVRLGDVAPDFTAETTEGPLQFHQWKGNRWADSGTFSADLMPSWHG